MSQCVCSFFLTLFPVFEHHLESSQFPFWWSDRLVSFGMCPLGMMHVFLSDQHCSVNPSHMANGSGVGRTDGWTTARVNENWDVAWPIFSETRKHLVIWDGPAGMNVACPSLADQNQIPKSYQQKKRKGTNPMFHFNHQRYFFVFFCRFCLLYFIFPLFLHLRRNTTILMITRPGWKSSGPIHFGTTDEDID